MQRKCPHCGSASVPLISTAAFTDSMTCPACHTVLRYSRGFSRVAWIAPLLVYFVWSRMAKPPVEAEWIGLAIATFAALGIALFTKLEKREASSLQSN